MSELDETARTLFMENGQPGRSWDEVEQVVRDWYLSYAYRLKSGVIGRG